MGGPRPIERVARQIPQAPRVNRGNTPLDRRRVPLGSARSRINQALSVARQRQVQNPLNFRPKRKQRRLDPRRDPLKNRPRDPRFGQRRKIDPRGVLRRRGGYYFPGAGGPQAPIGIRTRPRLGGATIPAIDPLLAGKPDLIAELLFADSISNLGTFAFLSGGIIDPIRVVLEAQAEMDAKTREYQLRQEILQSDIRRNQRTTEIIGASESRRALLTAEINRQRESAIPLMRTLPPRYLSRTYPQPFGRRGAALIN